jgi:hypothetical protein
VPDFTGAVLGASVSLLVGVFGGGSLVALLRVSADRGKVVVEAAQGAVIVQSSVIDGLREELGRLKAESERQRAELIQLRRQNAEQARRLAALESE